MSKNEFDIDIDAISNVEDAYDYSDLEDLSLIPPKRKIEINEDEDSDNETDELEINAIKAMKILGIVTGVLVLIVVIFLAVKLVGGNLNKNTYEYNFNSGVTSYSEKKYEEAIEYFEKALTYEEANNVDERMYLYRCYISIDDNENAIQSLLDLLKYDENNTDAVSAVAAYYFNNSMFTELDAFVEKYKGTELEAVLSTYLIDAPAISHQSGTYNGSIDVVLFSSTGDAIYYTLDGTNPTQNDNMYSAPVKIEKGTTVLRAVVINSAGISSEVIECVYTVEYVVPDTPEVSPASGSYTENQQISILNVTEGLTAYYTLDGSVPTVNSEVYKEPIDMPGGNNIFSVIFINQDNIASAVVKRNYNLKVTEKYAFNDCVSEIKKMLATKGEINADGTATVDGEEIKFVYYAKREVNKVEMYLMYYDIKSDEGMVRQDYLWGVDVQKGTTYKVTEVNGVFTSEQYK